MNPDTNRFEPLKETEEMKKLRDEFFKTLLRPNGEPVPKTWTIFKVGEEVVIKNYTFRVAYIGETSILFEPVGPVIINAQGDCGVSHGETR